MKRLIPALLLIIVGCTSSQEKPSSAQTSQDNLVIVERYQSEVSHTNHWSGYIGIENVRFADGSKLTPEQYQKLKELDGYTIVGIRVDDSGATNAIVDEIK